MADKLFSQHEATRKAAEAATARYERSIREGSKADEPDNEGTRSKQIGRVRREAGKGIR